MRIWPSTEIFWRGSPTCAIVHWSTFGSDSWENLTCCRAHLMNCVGERPRSLHHATGVRSHSCSIRHLAQIGSCLTLLFPLAATFCFDYVVLISFLCFRIKFWVTVSLLVGRTWHRNVTINEEINVWLSVCGDNFQWKPRNVYSEVNSTDLHDSQSFTPS